jgi:TRAP-type mannitol/chloroaromatic compound transport system permease large subunit
VNLVQVQFIKNMKYDSNRVREMVCAARLSSKVNVYVFTHLGTSVFLMKKFSCPNSPYMISKVVSVFIYTQFCSFGLINSLNISLIRPLRKEQKIRG